MDWLKERVFPVIVIIYIIGLIIWTSARFNELDKELTIIKTVLIKKDIYPKELDEKLTEKFTNVK